MLAGVVIPVCLILLIIVLAPLRLELFRSETLTLHVVLPLLTYEFKLDGNNRQGKAKPSRVRSIRRLGSLLTPLRSAILYLLDKSTVFYTKNTAEINSSLPRAITAFTLEASVLALVGAYSKKISAESICSEYGFKYKISIRTRVLFLINSLFVLLYYIVKRKITKRIKSVG